MANQDNVPKFNAPVPKMRDGIKALMHIHATLFVSKSLMNSVVKCFQATGVAPIKDKLLGIPVFKQYQLSTRHGTHETMVPKSLSEDNDLCLGGSLLPIDLRNECDSDDETYNHHDQDHSSDEDSC